MEKCLLDPVPCFWELPRKPPTSLFNALKSPTTSVPEESGKSGRRTNVMESDTALGVTWNERGKYDDAPWVVP